MYSSNDWDSSLNANIYKTDYVFKTRLYFNKIRQIVNIPKIVHGTLWQVKTEII